MTKRGRPPMPEGQSKADVLTVRVQPGEREAIQAEAAKAGQEISEWVRQKLVGNSPVKVTRTVLEYGAGEYRMFVNTPSPLPKDQWEILVRYVTDVLKPAE